MTIDVARLPTRLLRAGTELYRVHLASNQPWFFSSGPGRFDPVMTPGSGACYWTENELGAWVEAFRTRMLVPDTEIAIRALSVATLSTDVVVCDLTVRRALAAGVTAAVATSDDYRVPQTLADALQARHAGVRWRVRHDLRQRLIGIAWFGPAGVADAVALADLPPTITGDIPEWLVARACRTFGYEVLPGVPT